MNFGVFLETTAAGDRFLHMFWHRVQDPTGTTNMDFEFNKSETLRRMASRPFAPSGDVADPVRPRTAGRTPMLFFPAGLTVPRERGRGCEASNAALLERPVNLTDSGDADGSINTSPIPSPNLTGSVTSQLGPSARQPWTSTLSQDGECTGFGSAYLKSRASDSFTAALKDFIAPVPTNVSNCGSIKIIKQTDPDATAGSFGFTTTNLGGSTSAFPMVRRKFPNVLAGASKVKEDATAGFRLTDINCTGETASEGRGRARGDDHAGRGRERRCYVREPEARLQPQRHQDRQVRGR